MANTILATDQVTDGYSIRVSRDGRPLETVYFHTLPADVQAAVDAWAVGMAAREAAEAAANDWEIVEA